MLVSTFTLIPPPSTHFKQLYLSLSQLPSVRSERVRTCFDNFQSISNQCSIIAHCGIHLERKNNFQKTNIYFVIVKSYSKIYLYFYGIFSTARHQLLHLILHEGVPGGVARHPLVLGALHVLASLELRFTI